MEAYVLVQTQIGRTRDVTWTVSHIDGVEYAEPITGPYDVVVRVHGPDLFTLTTTVLDRIHGIDGVTRAVACPIESSPELSAATA